MASSCESRNERAYVNCVPATKGRVAAICCCCGRRSKPSTPDKNGEPNLWEIGRGWSEAPYPHEFKHDDGSVGSTFTCPPCNKRLAAGETLTHRDHYVRNVL